MRRIISVLATLALACGLLFTNPGTAQAAPHHHNTLPYPTGCGRNAVVISRQNMAGGTASVVYSRNCGTNWIEWYGPAITTAKSIYAGTSWTIPEWDHTRWSYSRQVSAPGSTPIGALIQVFPSNGPMEDWGVSCQWTCTWTRYA
ncbi:hypothetical protein [Arachnia propionica]|uniref:DUF2690 domain-containing protein n=1 Tax=Arachnia propionica TaxID=1750 RepID=A0A3P1WWU5_9ACTN|nr:hypothetical protein [Arachnia propionica]RRD50516.1 hypothetical protein EII35_03705 [Arachnia propionica]